MKYISWNVRGLEALDKKQIVKRFLDSNKDLDFLMLQELKTINFTLDINLNFIWKDSIKIYSKHLGGKGGVGLLINPRWSNHITNKGCSPCNRAVWASINVDNTLIGVCSIYASNDYKERSALWDWIASLPNIPWILGGDFNMIENCDDKMGGNAFEWKGFEKSHWDRMKFKKNLFDPLFGNKANTRGLWNTWCNFQKGCNRIYCRLDHFYANKDVFSFIHSNHGNSVVVWPFTLSHHHPITAHIKLANSLPANVVGPKKFILNTNLLKDLDALAAINLIRLLNKDNKNLASHIDQKLLQTIGQKLLQTIGQKRAKDSRFVEKTLNLNLLHLENEIQLTPSCSDLANQVAKTRDALRLRQQVKIKRAMIRARSHWLQFGDKGSKIDEIQKAINSLHNDKAPGPDGLLVEFYKANLNWICSDLLDIYNEALGKGSLGNVINKGTIKFIPKDGDKALVKNWRPITLLNVSYKILAKMLAVRLEKILPKFICPTQTDFIKGRYILENLITSWEAMEWSKVSDQDTTMFLLDFEKAYDRVEWDFIIMMLEAFGFPSEFYTYVKVLLQDASTQIDVNGSLSSSIMLSRSIRQGCPLAPALFVIASDALFYLFRDNSLSPKILEIQKAIRHFLWSDGKGNTKLHAVNWKWCHTKKSLGGLGLKDLRIQGIALAAKWIFHSLKGQEPWKVLIRHNIERAVPKNAKSWKGLPLIDLVGGGFPVSVQGTCVFKSIWKAWEHVRRFLVASTMNAERHKLLRFLKDGHATMFINEMKDGYDWRRNEDNLSSFEEALKKLNNEIKDNRKPSFAQVEMLTQIQSQKTIVWMEGPKGWVAWVEPHDDTLS
ncbi:uncharacterized protein LOC131876187 [Cryptomeria japonica]|uniref:uncharacterized protein LOC131876187 n=1 Tax=Cryptomeria japonica TaxID=3369 RepID=UPI0027DA926B|nr:uncharacterized protein LOC131876187 [Cryptomeria japonica]